MDFEDPLPEDQYTSDDPQTQSTQQASQHQEDLERHLWGALIPCNSQIARVDLWKIQAVYEVGRNPTSNQVVFPGPKISTFDALPIVRRSDLCPPGNFHCRLVWDRKDTRDSVVTVSDFSSNGTFVSCLCPYFSQLLISPQINGVKVGKGSTRVLREGNEIAFGSPTPQTDDKQDYSTHEYLRFIHARLSHSNRIHIPPHVGR